MHIDPAIKLTDLAPDIDRVINLAGAKILSLSESWDPTRGGPVFTEAGWYTTRGWTEWTQGFQFGMALLAFDLTGDERFLRIGMNGTLHVMPGHISHFGVHDHGFNIVSTFGQLLRLMNEGRIEDNRWHREYLELALKLSGAVQASRWQHIFAGLGYIYSFNGRHSLFADTIRSLRSLAVAYQLGLDMSVEQDEKVNVFHRLLAHAEITARYTVYYGEGRDAYDVPGRVAHESLFNPENGSYRCPSSQQGYSPFTTWMRGLAWVLLGFAEQLEFLSTIESEAFPEWLSKENALRNFERAATVVAEYYIHNTSADGIPFWDSGAPGLASLAEYREKISDPFNECEPVDSSAACIAAQGFLRLGNVLRANGHDVESARYIRTGLHIARSLFREPYISADPHHQGLILHAVYHRPNGWDCIPAGRRIPCGESCLWGDYHALELALMIRRMALDETYYQFFLR